MSGPTKPPSRAVGYRSDGQEEWLEWVFYSRISDGVRVPSVGNHSAYTHPARQDTVQSLLYTVLESVEDLEGCLLSISCIILVWNPSSSSLYYYQRKC